LEQGNVMSRHAWLAVLGLLAGCPRAAGDGVDAGALAVLPRAPARTPLLATPVEEAVPNVTLLPARVFVAQVKATPDQKEAETLADALQKAGVQSARVQRADLGAKGLWFRVTVGSWPRKDLMDARAPAMVASDKVRELLGPVVLGDPTFVPQEVPRFLATPASLLAALGRLPSDGGPWTATLVQVGEQVRAVVTAGKDVRILGQDGAVLDTVAAPTPACVDCTGTVGPVSVLFAGDVVQDAEPELLLGVGQEGKRAAVWMVKTRGSYVPVASAMVQRTTGHDVLVAEWAFRQLDVDEDLEALWTGSALAFSDGGALCAATPLAAAWDLTPGGRARVMDERLHAANGVARRQGGSEEIRAFLKGSQERAPELALAAALAYLAEAPDDADLYRDVVARAEAAGKEGRRGMQLKALAGLVAARHEWRVGLAPRLHEVLPLVKKQAQAQEGKTCEAMPLLPAAQAQRARHDPRDALNAALKRADARLLNPSELAALMVAFEKGSPLADDVADVVGLLEESMPRLVTDARQVVAQKRAGQNNNAALTPVPPASALDLKPATTPLPRAEEAEDRP
jgi:hypothetical protein